MDEQVSNLYRRFADLEAAGVSDIYYEWASGVAADAEVTTLIAQLPAIKRQPNLVFAAARWTGAPASPYPQFREWLTDRWAEVVREVVVRSTQTNEAARCAVLLPVLSRLEGPLALIEVGASAGLVLHPDRYSYRYDSHGSTAGLDPATGVSDVVIPCQIDRASIPSRLPEIVWRAGVDLNPIDSRDTDEMAWLETLVWPEHVDRRERLRSAARIAEADPALMVRGDLLDVTPDLIGRAPAGSHVVVFHSAVLNYLMPHDRESFASMMREHPAVTWISNEGEGVLPSITQQVQKEIHGRTILAVNGEAVALVGPHGQSYEAL